MSHVFCPNGEDTCIPSMCEEIGCFRERLREQGYHIVDGAVVPVKPPEPELRA